MRGFILGLATWASTLFDGSVKWNSMYMSSSLMMSSWRLTGRPGSADKHRERKREMEEMLKTTSTETMCFLCFSIQYHQLQNPKKYSNFFHTKPGNAIVDLHECMYGKVEFDGLWWCEEIRDWTWHGFLHGRSFSLALTCQGWTKVQYVACQGDSWVSDAANKQERNTQLLFGNAEVPETFQELATAWRELKRHLEMTHT